MATDTRHGDSHPHDDSDDSEHHEPSAQTKARVAEEVHERLSDMVDADNLHELFARESIHLQIVAAIKLHGAEKAAEEVGRYVGRAARNLRIDKLRKAATAPGSTPLHDLPHDLRDHDAEDAFERALEFEATQREAASRTLRRWFKEEYGDDWEEKFDLMIRRYVWGFPAKEVAEQREQADLPHHTEGGVNSETTRIKKKIAARQAKEPNEVRVFLRGHGGGADVLSIAEHLDWAEFDVHELLNQMEAAGHIRIIRVRGGNHKITLLDDD